MKPGSKETKTVILPGGEATNTGPYSPGLSIGELVFVSGQGPQKGTSHEIVGDTVEEQAEVTLNNVREILKAAGCTMDDCVKATVHLSDMANFDRMNAVYKKFFKAPYPTRTTVQSVLWHHIMIEIDVIAIRGCGQTKR